MKGAVRVEILYQDADIVVCIKPGRVLSTDEPGGLPDLLREAFGTPKGDFRTVHRLDRVVSGVMVVARNAGSASELSRQIRENEFGKTYYAVIHGILSERKGTLRDLLGRDKARKMTYVAPESGKGIQEAVLDYRVIGEKEEQSLVEIHLHTGRTHQIRVQFASRGFPLVGERKYAIQNDDCEIALWSREITFTHPATGEHLRFTKNPPRTVPWADFEEYLR